MGESCDDGNDISFDGCEVNCKPTIQQIAAGALHTCVLLGTGAVRCWGDNEFGQLGYGHTDHIGDEPGEMPPPDLDLGGPVARLALGFYFSCALLESGAVRCWGENKFGHLGLGHVDGIGDEPGEMPPPDVALPRDIVEVAAGHNHACVRSIGGGVRCWGWNYCGQLGQGHVDNLGDEPGEMPPPPIPLGGDPLAIMVARHHNCGLFEGGEVRCWGTYEGLGYESTEHVGDDPGEMPPPPVPAGGEVAQLGGHGNNRTCARLVGGEVRCWGYNWFGSLGYGPVMTLGDQPGEMPTPLLMLGGPAIELTSGPQTNCVRLESGPLRCWGLAPAIGSGNTNDLGDDPGELPPPDVLLGGELVEIALGWSHSCALLDGSRVRCWGYNSTGQLGRGDMVVIGDDETPDAVDVVPVF